MDRHTPAVVLDEAADLAEQLHAKLTVVHVDPSRVVIGARRDGTRLVVPVDPDLPDNIHQPVLDLVRARVSASLAGRPVTWTLRTTVGDPVTGIAHIAEEVGGGVIVVGTRGSGLRHGLRRLVEGSVSAQLARHQHLPVLVVPGATPR
jgi:nucleotide-binding universal stress UspA family protein